MASATVTIMGQVISPVEMRVKLGLRAGSRRAGLRRPRDGHLRDSPGGSVDQRSEGGPCHGRFGRLVATTWTTSSWRPQLRTPGDWA